MFPRPAYKRAFDTIREREGDKRACKITVELLALAHERTCEAELAVMIEADLEAGRLPNVDQLRARLIPESARLPEVVVELVVLGAYDELAEVVSREIAQAGEASIAEVAA